MIIRYILKDHGSGRMTWRVCDGNYTRHRTALRKVTNRKLKKKLWFNGTSLTSY